MTVRVMVQVISIVISSTAGGFVFLVPDMNKLKTKEVVQY